MPPRLLCLLSALAPLCLGQQQGEEAFDFYAAEEEGEELGEGAASACFEAGVRCRTMDALLQAGYGRMRALAASGRRPLALHVGADGLQNKAGWTDVHLYRRVLEHVGPSLPPNALRLAFVEPVAEKSEQFWRNVGQLPVAPSQVSLVTAMVGDCARPEASMYKISEQRVAQDFGFDTAICRGWAATDPEHPIGVTLWWAENDMPVVCAGDTGDCRSQFRQFASSPNIASYLEEIRIPCLALGDLLEKELGAEVEDLAMMVVDAEGHDEQILASILGSSAFKPGFFMWEKGDEHSTLLAELRKKGYEVGLKPGSALDLYADSPNVIAVLPELLRGSDGAAER